MSDDLDRFRRYMAVESEFLAAEARRARLLDHKGNRGTSAEYSLLQWLRSRVEPEFTVSSGEIVDSFSTNHPRDNRQHDAIVHRNTRFARRFTLPSGLRMVPIEEVALVVEIKLSVDAQKFRDADAAASDTASLRLALEQHVVNAGAGGVGGLRTTVKPGPIGGLPISAPEVAGRLEFALFAFEGPSRVETLAEWLRSATTIRTICCLGGGCATRPRYVEEIAAEERFSQLAGGDLSLAVFGQLVDGAISRFEANAHYWHTSGEVYDGYTAPYFWDASGFTPREGYLPGEAEIAELQRLGHLPAGWRRG